ncbi:Uncharacterised protein [Suttonella ornithocola]|uniref:Uncharacterized protein n=1 Tax=Suttonella ornithocola TaxID=279832 RepID=A0A380MZ94_9GAMM|nr:Uncharacterised protein [Suttonella ornithocola]
MSAVISAKNNQIVVPYCRHRIFQYEGKNYLCTFPERLTKSLTLLYPEKNLGCLIRKAHTGEELSELEIKTLIEAKNTYFLTVNILSET